MLGHRKRRHRSKGCRLACREAQIQELETDAHQVAIGGSTQCSSIASANQRTGDGGQLLEHSIEVLVVGQELLPLGLRGGPRCCSAAAAAIAAESPPLVGADSGHLAVALLVELLLELDVALLVHALLAKNHKAEQIQVTCALFTASETPTEGARGSVIALSWQWVAMGRCTLGVCVVWRGRGRGRGRELHQLRGRLGRLLLVLLVALVSLRVLPLVRARLGLVLYLRRCAHRFQSRMTAP